MKPLSREASAALSALKSPEPSAADEARVRQNLERTLGLVIPVAGVAAGASAATAQAATGAGMSGAAGGATALSLGAKVAGLVVAVGLGTTLTVVAVQAAMTSAPEPAQIVAAPPPKPVVPTVQNTIVEEVIAPEVVAPEVTVEEPPAAAPAPKPTKSAPAVRASPAKVSQEVAPSVAQAPPAPVEAAPAEPTEAGPEVPPAPAANSKESYDLQIETQFPNCDPATEMRSALNARRLLVANRAEEAVGLLEAYQRRCPSGRWSNEAWAVRVGGLCMLGRNSEARGFLDWFSSESPERRAAVVGDLHQWCSPELLKP
jgi:hypothetical protein